MRFSRDEQDAADIMSSAFVKMFKAIRAYDINKGSFYAWLKRIIVNEALDHMKGREKFYSEVELETEEAPSIDNAVIDKINAAEIMKQIQKLPPATHAVFVMYAIEGYNHREIAEMTGISKGTSNWHLSDARKKLKQQLEQYQY